VIKKVLAILGVIVAVLVILALAVPFFINVDQFRPRVEGQLSSSLGRQVHIGKLSLSLLTGELGATAIAISDELTLSRFMVVWKSSDSSSCGSDFAAS